MGECGQASAWTEEEASAAEDASALSSSSSAASEPCAAAGKASIMDDSTEVVEASDAMHEVAVRVSA